MSKHLTEMCPTVKTPVRRAMLVPRILIVPAERTDVRTVQAAPKLLESETPSAPIVRTVNIRQQVVLAKVAHKVLTWTRWVPVYGSG